jgi:hypothetical protein
MAREERNEMIRHKVVESTFRKGDAVVLAEGTYQGTAGVFLGFRDDVNWADISETNGRVRSHPVAWLAHSAHGLSDPQNSGKS